MSLIGWIKKAIAEEYCHKNGLIMVSGEAWQRAQWAMVVLQNTPQIMILESGQHPPKTMKQIIDDMEEEINKKEDN